MPARPPRPPPASRRLQCNHGNPIPSTAASERCNRTGAVVARGGRGGMVRTLPTCPVCASIPASHQRMYVYRLIGVWQQKSSQRPQQENGVTVRASGLFPHAPALWGMWVALPIKETVFRWPKDARGGCQWKSACARAVRFVPNRRRPRPPARLYVPAIVPPRMRGVASPCTPSFTGDPRAGSGAVAGVIAEPPACAPLPMASELGSL